METVGNLFARGSNKDEDNPFMNSPSGLKGLCITVSVSIGFFPSSASQPLQAPSSEEIRLLVLIFLLEKGETSAHIT